MNNGPKTDIVASLRAERECRAILETQPENVGVLQQLGELLHMTGRAVEASTIYERVLALDPRHAPAWSLLGVIRRQGGNPQEAARCLEHAVALQPRSADHHYNLGNALFDLEQLDAAAKSFRRAIALRPNFAFAHNNLGLICERMGHLAEAASHYRRALETKRDNIEAAGNLSSVLYKQNRLDAALEHARQAIVLDPHFAGGHWNEAMILLTQGDLERGFAKYEWRWKLAHAPSRNLPGHAWQGEPLSGKTILLYAEQGFGDTIQFLRFVPMVVRLGSRVVVEVPQPLVRLAKSVHEGVDIIPAGTTLPRYDVHCALGTLPLRFRTRLGTIPAAIPYLSVDVDLSLAWRQRIGGGERCAVGFAWAGSPRHKEDARRSLPLEMLAPLFEVSGVDGFSLQVGDRSADLRRLPLGRIVDLSAKLSDFAETAGAIENLDLVVCVDTALAHLAGALGKPVFLLNRLDTDWRWFLDREDSPWYPTMRIFRQARFGEWDEVIVRATAELARFARGTRKPRPDPRRHALAQSTTNSLAPVRVEERCGASPKSDT
jgi:tetratricopeptide (TPR) repeat protein